MPTFFLEKKVGIKKSARGWGSKENLCLTRVKIVREPHRLSASRPDNFLRLIRLDFHFLAPKARLNADSFINKNTGVCQSVFFYNYLF